MQETWVRSLGQEDPPEKRMSIHSSILTWRIPMDREAWWAPLHGIASLTAQLVKSLPAMQDPGSIPGSEGIGYPLQYSWASLCGSASKESACNVGDLSSIPGLGRSLGEGIFYPLQYSSLENSKELQRVEYNWATFTISDTIWYLSFSVTISISIHVVEYFCSNFLIHFLYWPRRQGFIPVLQMRKLVFTPGLMNFHYSTSSK